MRLFNGAELIRPSRWIQSEFEIPTDIYEQVLELESITEGWSAVAGEMLALVYAYQRIAMKLSESNFDTSNIKAVLLDQETLHLSLNPQFMNRLVYLISLTSYHKIGGDHEHPGDFSQWEENNQFEMDPEMVLSRGGNA